MQDLGMNFSKKTYNIIKIPLTQPFIYGIIIYVKIKYRRVEQLVARRAHNPEVAGSSPVPAPISEQVSLVPIFLCKKDLNLRKAKSVKKRLPVCKLFNFLLRWRVPNCKAIWSTSKKDAKRLCPVPAPKVKILSILSAGFLLCIIHFSLFNIHHSLRTTGFLMNNE